MDSYTDPASQQLDDNLSQHILHELLPLPEAPEDLEEFENHDILLDSLFQTTNPENDMLEELGNSDSVSTP